VPTYQYACTECGGQIEAVQRFSDDPLTVHEACGGKLRKVFSPVGIVFKGSGFYRTDSRSSASTTSSASSSSAPSDAGAASPAASSPESGSSPASSAGAEKKAAPVPSGSVAKAGAASKSSEKVA
jgi:putative FmdB family regulatory protein